MEPITIIENTREARDTFGYGFGADYTVVQEKDLCALRQGKCWAFAGSSGEYVHFITLDTKKTRD